ncbi:phosphotransferase [Flammeovirgaceae bacterium SG7u.111]|nr:phosphotransferase [Flammeovirgaceae bacterium SG7u.132]WPO34206.1 phosphotransferase [Flammeovirgaceae bacterium SG7u.111]
MNYAPAYSSIISPEYLAEFVIEHYGFDNQTTCRMLKTGVNHTYLITTSNRKFVLRVYFLHWRTEKEIISELDLLGYLKENNISVSYPIRDKNTALIQRIKAVEGERFAVLFSYAEGESIRNPPEELCYTLGKTIAKMHQLTVNKRINRIKYDADSLTNWAYELSKTFFSESSDEMQYFERANSIIASQLSGADASKLRYGAIHLDLWHDNMKVKNELEITLFDFDNCGNGWLFLDIAYSLMLIFRNEPNKELFNKKRDQFYKGYESITSISSEEKRLIPYGGLAIWLHYTGIHVQRFTDFSNQFLSHEFLKFWIHTVNQWMEFNRVKV